MTFCTLSGRRGGICDVILSYLNSFTEQKSRIENIIFIYSYKECKRLNQIIDIFTRCLLFDVGSFF